MFYPLNNVPYYASEGEVAAAAGQFDLGGGTLRLLDQVLMLHIFPTHYWSDASIQRLFKFFPIWLMFRLLQVCTC